MNMRFALISVVLVVAVFASQGEAKIKCMVCGSRDTDFLCGKDDKGKSTDCPYSDSCLKVAEAGGSEKVMRTCSTMPGKLNGCLDVKGDKEGEGQMCLCDTNDCNPASMAQIASGLLLVSTVASASLAFLM